MSQTTTSQVSDQIEAARERLAVAVADRHFQREPELLERYGQNGYRRTVEDARFHLQFLGQALAVSEPSFFVDYISWARSMLSERGVPADLLARNLEILSEVLAEELPAEAAAVASDYIGTAIAALPQAPVEIPSLFDESSPYAALAREYLDLLLAARRHDASQLILGAVERGMPVRDVYLYVFQPCQLEIGRLWQLNRISVAEEHSCTAATQLIMSQLYPLIFSSERVGRTLVAACAAENLHEIGLRMVADFFEMEGWNTHYLGANVPVRSVVDLVREQKADLLAISATAAFHVSAVVELIAAVRAEPGCEGVMILVGGAPFTKEPGLWKQVGADGCAGDAGAAVEVGKQLVEAGTSR